MKVRMKIRDLNYGDVAVLFLPKLVEKTADRGLISDMVQAVAELPEELLRDMLGAIPTERKDRITAALFEENRDRVLEKLNSQLTAKTGLTVSSLTVTEALEVEAELEDIDVIDLTEKLLPMLREMDGEGGVKAVLGMAASLPKALWLGALQIMPQAELMEKGVSLLNRSGDAICAAVTERLARNQIRCTLTNLRAEL